MITKSHSLSAEGRAGQEKLKIVREMGGWSKGLTKIFAEPKGIFDASYGLTLREVKTLRFLLLRCCKNYHSAHPSDFLLRLLLDSAEKEGGTSDT